MDAPLAPNPGAHDGAVSPVQVSFGRFPVDRYSETVMDHFQSPRHWGCLEQPDRVGVAGVPGRGRFLVLHLELEANRIVAARFRSHGCGATIAAGSVLTEMIVGQSIAACLAITPDAVLEALDGLPPDKIHCAGFAVAALRDALNPESLSRSQQTHEE